MATLQVKRLPQDLHNALRERAADEGISMSELVIRLLRVEMSFPSAAQWLAEVDATHPGTHVEVDIESLMDDVREDSR